MSKYQVTRQKAPTYEVNNSVSLAGLNPEVETEWSDAQKLAIKGVRETIEGGHEWWCRFMQEVGEEHWDKVIGWSQPMAVAEPPDYGDPEWDPDYQPRWEVHITAVPHEERKRVMSYLRRRYSMSLQAAQKAIDSLPHVLRKGMSRPEAEDLLPDLLALGCSAEIVEGEEQT